MRWLWISGGVGLGLVIACGESEPSPSEPPSEAPVTGGSTASGGADAASGGTATGTSGRQPSSGGSPASSTGGTPSTGGNPEGVSGGRSSGASAGEPSQAGGAELGGAGAGEGGAGGALPDSAEVTVRLDRVQQTIEGFGISNLHRYSMMEEQAEQVFDLERGLGLTIFRVLVDPSGHPVSLESDVAKALARGASTFIAVPETAPAECKTNRNQNDGGYLEQSCYESWSDVLAAFPARFKQATGVDLYGLSPQNEPDFASCGLMQPVSPCHGNFASMLYTPEQMVEFVKVLGPKLRALDPPVRLMGPETQEWNHLWTNRSSDGASDPLEGNYDYGHALFADPVAWGFVDVLATHFYGTQAAEPWPSDVPRTKPIWMTELAGFEFWPEGELTTSIENGLVNAGWIHDALVNGNASAWLYRAHRAQRRGSNEGLALDDGTLAKRYYTFGQFSRYVRPGFERVSVSGEVPAGLLLSAFRGPDDQFVLVAINRGASNVSLPIYVSGGTTPSVVTPVVTSATEDWTKKPEIVVDGDSFPATLESQSVTTFVGSAE